MATLTCAERKGRNPHQDSHGRFPTTHTRVGISEVSELSQVSEVSAAAARPFHRELQLQQNMKDDPAN